MVVDVSGRGGASRLVRWVPSHSERRSEEPQASAEDLLRRLAILVVAVTPFAVDSSANSQAVSEGAILCNWARAREEYERRKVERARLEDEIAELRERNARCRETLEELQKTLKEMQAETLAREQGSARAQGGQSGRILNFDTKSLPALEQALEEKASSYRERIRGSLALVSSFSVEANGHARLVAGRKALEEKRAYLAGLVQRAAPAQGLSADPIQARLQVEQRRDELLVLDDRFQALVNAIE